jgi:hypothetical protein
MLWRGSIALSLASAGRWTWRAGALASGLLVAGVFCAACGPKARPAEGSSAAAGGAPRVRSLAHPDRPTLRLVHREGDPHGVLAGAVFTTDGSRGALLLAELVLQRLRAVGREPDDVQIHGIGFVLAFEIRRPGDAARLLDALRQALIEPVAPGEVAAARLPSRLRDAAEVGESPSLTAACSAEFGAEGARGLSIERAPTADELEEVRQASVRSGRIGLAVLGRPALLDEVAEHHVAKWPAGHAPSEAWPAEDQLAVRTSAGLFELEVALRVPDQARALAAGQALQRPDHPAFTRLLAVDAELRPGPVTVTLRPVGACLSLGLVREGPLAPTTDTLTAATLILEQELLRALDTRADDSSVSALLSPEDALEAASLAAWTAVSAPRVDSPVRTLVEAVVPETTRLRTTEFAGLLRATDAAWSKREIPLSSRVEYGQPESWLLLASPCGTAPETGQDAGLRALALESAARAFDGALSVALEPWVEPTAMGLLAHALPKPDETPVELARRLARASVHALSLASVDGRAIAAARSAQLGSIGSDPGLDRLIRSLSGERPSALDARGLEREVAVLSTLDVNRARYALSREPLRAAYLAGAADSEPLSARTELGRLLGPHRSDVLPCPAQGPELEGPGAWTVSSVDAHVVPGAFVGVPVATRPTSGYALEFLLNREDGYLDRGLVAAGLAETARARFLPGVFGAALLVEVRAPKPDRDRAVAQVRAVLAALSAGVPKTDVELARNEDARRRALAERGPRGRIVELWMGELPPPPTEASLSALGAQLGAEQHRVVRVDVRAE